MEYDELLEIIKDVLPIKRDVQPDSKLKEDLGLCSFDMMLIILKLEKYINNEVDTSEFAKADTVNELYKIVKQGNRNG